MMKRSLLTIAMSAALLASNVAGAAETLKMTCGPRQPDKELCKYVTERFESTTGAKLETVEWPFSSSDQLTLLQQMFSTKEGTVDVVLVDVVWPGLLGKHLMDLTGYMNNDDGRFFEANWNNNIVDGKLKAVPAFTGAPMLYYRKDLLEKYNKPVPTTWKEMQETAQYVQDKQREAGNDGFWGYVFQGKAYEGLTCDALEWVHSFGGGSIVETDGTISINNKNAADALDTAASWVGTITPRGVLGYMEEESRAVFQNGDALFMRNWPYAWSGAQADGSVIKGKVGVAVLPKQGDKAHNAATLGGWQAAVNNYSEHKELAVKLVDILTDKETQKKRFELTAATPTMKALYNDADVLAQAPHIQQYLPVFESAVSRPSTVTASAYNKVSKAFYNTAFNVLSGEQTGTQAVASLEKKLKRIKGRSW